MSSVTMERYEGTTMTEKYSPSVSPSEEHHLKEPCAVDIKALGRDNLSASRMFGQPGLEVKGMHEAREASDHIIIT